MASNTTMAGSSASSSPRDSSCTIVQRKGEEIDTIIRVPNDAKEEEDVEISPQQMSKRDLGEIMDNFLREMKQKNWTDDDLYDHFFDTVGDWTEEEFKKTTTFKTRGGTVQN